MVWRLLARGSPADIERAEHTARRAIAVCFFALAAYIALEAGRDLWKAEPPERSLAAVLIAGASAAAMPLLARLKRRLALRMGMASLASEAMQTAICGYLSLILLAALAVYQVTGWWWVDAVGALAMVPIIVREGNAAWRGKSCGCHG
jgi:divalent metal cation (Fe/Co/Zn/Cd) transporter